MLDEVNRERAKVALESSQQHYASNTLAFVHYECGEIGQSRSVHAVAINNPDLGTTKLFSSREGEKLALLGLAEYLRSISETHLLCVWGMRNDSYGFQHLHDRLSELTNGESCILMPHNVVDLSNVCWQLYGDIDTSGRRKMPYLCEVNGISTQGCAEHQSIQDAVKQGRWEIVQASVSRKVEMIYALWCRMVRGNLITGMTADEKAEGVQATQQKRKRGRPPKSGKDRKREDRIYDGWKTGRWKDRLECAEYNKMKLKHFKRLIDRVSKQRRRSEAKYQP